MALRTTIPRVDWSQSINKGLVAWWPMWEGAGGKILDISGKSNHGTLTNGPVWVDGLKFDGTDDYVGGFTVSNFDSITNEVTFAATVQTPSPLATRMDLIQRSVGADSWWFNLQSGLVSFYADNVTGGAYKQSLSPITSDKTNIAVVYNGSTIKFFINGRLDNTIGATGTLSTGSTSLFMASNNGGLGFYNGILYNLRMWSRGLIDSEAQRLHINPHAGLYIPDIARYYLPAAGGSSIVPDKGNPMLVTPGKMMMRG